MVDLTILGISLQDEGVTPVLLLHPHGTELILCIHIDPAEAFAISRALHATDTGASASSPAPAATTSDLSAPITQIWDDLNGGPDAPRGLLKASSAGSMTHDLAISLIKSLGGQLLGVEIIGLREGNFFAEAVLSTGTGIVRVECRPSDGVALALRCGAVLRCTEEAVRYAEDMNRVFERLPAHIRTLAQAALLEEQAPQKAQQADFSGIPLRVEAILHREIKKAASGATVTVAKTPKVTQGPQVEIKLLRASPPAEARPASSAEDSATRERTARSRLLEVLEVEAGAIPAQVQESLGGPFGTSLGALHAAATGEGRWSALLRMLAPETKELM